MKHVQVRLQDDEYRLLTAAMKEHDVGFVQEAVIVAIKSWACHHATNNLGKLTKLEERRVAAILRYMRDEPDGFLLAAIDKLGEV